MEDNKKTARREKRAAKMDDIGYGAGLFCLLGAGLTAIFSWWIPAAVLLVAAFILCWGFG